VPKVTAIIPTLCARERAEHLRRAISSLKGSSTDAIAILLVVNGPRFDPELLSEMRSRPDVAVEQLAEASAALAQLHGRKCLRTEFFCFLDDDDEYLPGATDARLTALESRTDCDFVVTNGFKTNGTDHDRVIYERLNEVPRDPLGALLVENWMSSCGALFRTSSIPASFFDDPVDYIEWTWLAFKLAMANKRPCVLTEPTFRIYLTSDSASQSEPYMLTHTELFKRMLAMNARADVNRILKARLCESWHNISSYYRHRGSMRKAWSAHLNSLRHPAGWKYVAYTRRLFLPPLLLSSLRNIHLS
jgi:glycosyltransferase involved in cell wall biosynthesis